MKSTIAFLILTQFLLTSCAYGLKYIDKSKKTSSNWEPATEEVEVAKTNTKVEKAKKR
jgi:hypothetical protein